MIRIKNLKLEKISEAGSGYVFWLEVLINSVVKKDEYCYPHLFFNNIHNNIYNKILNALGLYVYIS